MLACLALLAALPATSRAACALANLAPFTARYEVSVLCGLTTVGEYRVSLARTGPDTFRYETVKLKRIPLPGEKPDYVWAAPRLCYLPVRIAYQRSEVPAFNMVLDALQGNIATAGQAQARTDNTAATP